MVKNAKTWADILGRPVISPEPPDNVKYLAQIEWISPDETQRALLMYPEIVKPRHMVSIAVFANRGQELQITARMEVSLCGVPVNTRQGKRVWLPIHTLITALESISEDDYPRLMIDGEDWVELSTYYMSE